MGQNSGAVPEFLLDVMAEEITGLSARLAAMQRELALIGDDFKRELELARAARAASTQPAAAAPASPIDWAAEAARIAAGTPLEPNSEPAPSLKVVAGLDVGPAVAAPSIAVAPQRPTRLASRLAVAASLVLLALGGAVLGQMHVQGVWLDTAASSLSSLLG
jgi:hypothetical protein